MSLNERGGPVSQQQTDSLLEEPKEVAKKGSEKTHGQKLKYTIGVYLVAMGLGASFAMIPATLLDLMSHTNSDIEQGSLIFMMSAIGYTMGSLVSGFLYDWCNKDFIFGSSAMLAGIFMMLVPVSNMFPVVVALLFISNIFQGTMDNGCTLLCAVVWGDEATSYQQAQALFYALGGIIAPVLAEPFLMKTSEEERNMSAFVTTNSNSTGFMSENRQLTNTKLVIPFIILGLFCILSSLPFIGIFIKTKLKRVAVHSKTEHKTKAAEQSANIHRKYLLAACTLLTMFFMAFGYILGLGEFSMPFLVDYLGFSKTDGTRLNSVFWAAMAGGCFIGIFLGKILRPALMVIVTLIPITCGVIALLVGAKVHPIVVWISYIIVFLGTGSIYPAMISWVDQRLIRVNGRMCSLFTISGCIGDVTNALLLGYLFKYYSPMWLIYLTLGSVVVLWTSLLVIFQTRKCLSKHISPEIFNDNKQTDQLAEAVDRIIQESKT